MRDNVSDSASILAGHQITKKPKKEDDKLKLRKINVPIQRHLPVSSGDRSRVVSSFFMASVFVRSGLRAVRLAAAPTRVAGSVRGGQPVP